MIPALMPKMTRQDRAFAAASIEADVVCPCALGIPTPTLTTTTITPDTTPVTTT